MKKYLTIKIKKNQIDFGIPDTEEEIDKMFSLRYDIYLKHDYIYSNLEKRDIDEYDQENKCIYFIAKINNKIVGSVRIIKDKYLPTEKDCFEFKEPKKIKLIPRDQRIEISRLVVLNSNDSSIGYFPRHLLMLGLFYSLILYSKENNFLGGYSFIKNSLKKKLQILKAPFYNIEKFKQIYNKKKLKKYFNDTSNFVWPIYYVIDEMDMFIFKTFNTSIFFKKINNQEYIFRNSLIWKFLIKIFRLFSL